MSPLAALGRHDGDWFTVYSLPFTVERPICEIRLLKQTSSLAEEQSVNICVICERILE